MSKSLLLSFILVVAVLAFACAKSESTTNRDATAPAASQPATSPATTASSSDSIGVAECDAFIKSYEACVKDKVPEAARAQFNSTLAQWRKSWRDVAQNPQTRGTLAAACKAQIDAAKQSMKAYNCTF
jgi:uncharacterized membrane protein